MERASPKARKTGRGVEFRKAAHNGARSRALLRVFFPVSRQITSVYEEREGHCAYFLARQCVAPRYHKNTMIDLAISIDEGPLGVTIVETNHGDRLAAPKWPQDSDFRLVVFSPRAKECDVIAPRELARDIARALEAVKPTLDRAR